MPWAKWEMAHFALQATRIAPVSAGHYTFLEDLVEDGFMEQPSALRGE